MKVKKIKPRPGQESVWDYPRPPLLEEFKGHIRIVFNNQIILDTNRAFRILETSHPPTYYFPQRHFMQGILQPTLKTSYCEFKGLAIYYDLALDNRKASQAAWNYPHPSGDYASIKNAVSVYAHLMDACYVNGELVQAQDGDFYGGWITSNIVGPFKGGGGTWGW